MLIISDTVLFVCFVNRGMSHTKCDSDPWASCHGNRERKLDVVLPGISAEEEQQHSHPSLVLLSSVCAHSHASALFDNPLSTCTRAPSVSGCEDGYKENEAIWELYPSLSPVKVSSARGSWGRGIQVANYQCDRGGPGFLHL